MKRKIHKKLDYFYFPAGINKEEALSIINHARIGCSDYNDLYFICADLARICQYGFCNVNRIYGFLFDYINYLPIKFKK